VPVTRILNTFQKDQDTVTEECYACFVLLIWNLMHVGRGQQISQKSRSHLKLLSTRRVTWSSSMLTTHTSAVTCEPNCYLMPSSQCMWNNTYLYTRENTITIMLKILSTTIKNLVNSTKHLGFMHPWCKVFLLTGFQHLPQSDINTWHTFNIHKFYVLPTQCIYVFCMNLRTNSDYFPIQH
jgi:hypothetical protein